MLGYGFENDKNYNKRGYVILSIILIVIIGLIYAATTTNNGSIF